MHNKLFLVTVLVAAIFVMAGRCIADEGVSRYFGVVVNSETRQPVASAEIKGIRMEGSLFSLSEPNELGVTRSAEDGTFVLLIPKGSKRIHIIMASAVIVHRTKSGAKVKVSYLGEAQNVSTKHSNVITLTKI